MPKDIIILNNRGMLGNCVYKYFKSRNKYKIYVNNFSFPSKQFDSFFGYTLSKTEDPFVINCVGSIPQKHDDFSVNYLLPEYLGKCAGKIRVIHPSTDCEFSGLNNLGSFYEVTDQPDGVTDYAKSKIKGSEVILDSGVGKVIRSSIIGFSGGNKDLLGWFLDSEEEVDGYENHEWNGITTLQWSKVCEYMIDNFYDTPELVQVASDPITKYELLNIFKDVFKKKIKINKKFVYQDVVKLLDNSLLIPQHEWDIKDQLIELKEFYVRQEK
jgi:dTDP-4-dehydrorhamnose reductase